MFIFIAVFVLYWKGEKKYVFLYIYIYIYIYIYKRFALKTSKLKKLTISLCLLSSTCHNSCRPACQKHTPYGSIDASRPSALPPLFFNYPIYFYSLPNNGHHLDATCSFCACYDYCILHGVATCLLLILFVITRI